ncbi:hypothetical protein FTUN_4961 [Frigoriglobus tundricola]|uniref:Uncharacterized protein n=1 Tax=Frigoriglobus tundricola TaxID=2774151 RepID=A0A6M5YTH1_9BACT|nr:hypothetical protein FTUN_4961 [Frigoriglobus tundricola]
MYFEQSMVWVCHRSRMSKTLNTKPKRDRCPISFSTPAP